MITKDEIIAARMNVQAFCEVESKTRTAALDGIIKRVYALKGYTIAEYTHGEIDAQVNELANTIEQKWGRLTMGEIWVAMQAGVCGEFGQDKRLCVANYLSWLNSYTKSPERKEALIEMGQLARPAKPQVYLTSGEVSRRNEQACKDGLREAWTHYKRNDSLGINLNGWAACLTDYLIRIGKMKPTPETLQQVARNTRRQGVKDIRTLMDDLFDKGADGLDYAGKRGLLETYFANLKSRGAELTI